MKEEVLYFEEPGPQNTDEVIRAVRRKIESSGIRYVVVASESGRTALRVAESLRDLNVKVVCVTAYAGVRSEYEKKLGKSHYLSEEMKKKLNELNVKILDESEWVFYGAPFDHAFLKDHAPSTTIHRFLSRILGYGFKTAVEITLIAANVGAVQLDEEIIAIAGTGWMGGGADCALVVKPAPIFGGQFLDLKKGLEVREIIAIPRTKFTKEMAEKIKDVDKI